MKKPFLNICVACCLSTILMLCAYNSVSQQAAGISSIQNQVPAVLKTSIMTEAAWAMKQEPITVTDAASPRSAGGKHDFYSEGDYWWPNPAGADSPYVQRDGQTNPENFVAHRHAMIRFSKIVGALASAYILTRDQKYATHAMIHCRAWFIDSATNMNPNLLFAQAIKGRMTGRGIGIIDTIHFMEVVQGIMVFEKYGVLNKAGADSIRNWFSEYLKWLSTHQYGIDEMNAANNHGTCWVMQVATFSKFTGDKKLMKFCRGRYKNVLLPKQMAADGSFPLELKRTKPYGYSIFNLDAMVMICQVLSDEHDDLWSYETAESRSIETAESRSIETAESRSIETRSIKTRSIKKGISYLFPFVKNKKSWPLKPDVMFWEQWPVAQPFLLFGAIRFNNKDWFGLWQSLDHSPANEELIRNLPVRNPLIWI